MEILCEILKIVEDPGKGVIVEVSNEGAISVCDDLQCYGYKIIESSPSYSGSIHCSCAKVDGNKIYLRGIDSKLLGSSEIYRFWYEETEFCGCGMPEDVANLIHEYLNDIDLFDKDDSDNSYENRIKRLTKDDGYRYLVWYLLDAWGLTEHGGSVCGSWLTDKGKRLLKAFSDSEGDYLL